MKKRIRQAFAVILCLTVLMAATLNVRAALPPVRTGDVDMDRNVSITDVTVIQRALADLAELTKLQEYLADVDGSQQMDIIDATVIQRFLAGLPARFVTEDIYDWYMQDSYFYCDFRIEGQDILEPQTAYVGVPIHMSGRPTFGRNPITYAFFADGVCIREKSEDNTLEYTFESVGRHTVTMTMFNAFDYSISRSVVFDVTEAPVLEKPIITGMNFSESNWHHNLSGVVTADAFGGSGDYEFRFTVVNPGLMTIFYDIAEPSESETVEIPGPEPYQATMVREFSPKNTLSLADCANLAIDRWNTRLEITVEVRDAEGNVSDPVTVHYSTFDLVG